MKALISGLPISAKGIISDALDEIYGSGVVSILEGSSENIRRYVRRYTNNVNCVIIILDESSKEICKDIEDGLYSSDKFYSYTTDYDLVNYFNKKYGLNLEIEDVQEDLHVEDSGIDSSVIEDYIAQLSAKDKVIQNLKFQIIDLKNELEANGLSLNGKTEVSGLESEVSSLNVTIIDLKNSLLDYESSIADKDFKIKELTGDIESLKGTIKATETKYNALLADYKTSTDELSKMKISDSKKSGALRDRDSQITQLRQELESLNSTMEEYKGSIEEKILLEKRVSLLASDIEGYESTIKVKEDEIDRLSSELSELRSKSGGMDKTLSRLKGDIAKLTAENQSLSRDVRVVSSDKSELEQKIGVLSSDIDDYKSKCENYESDIEKLNERVKDDNESLSILNQEKIELKNRIDVLEKSSSRDHNMEDIVHELNDYKRRYIDLSNNVYSRVASYALPTSSSPINVTRKGITLKNVKFAFAGSTESRKGAYRCLLNEFSGISKTKNILLVDVVSETSVDYVFEIQKTINGIEWFRKGGSIQPYLSKTTLSNVSVLSPGLMYINDSYFLKIDWERRLSELEKSGYLVYIFCGDLSNIVGRVLHESFADLGDSTIYVHGSAVGSRSIITNIRGITNSRCSNIIYYDFNKKLKRFYDIVGKDHKCSIV